MSQSVRDLHQKFSMKEMYDFAQGNRNALCVFGYTVPKTYDYNYHEIEYSYPKEKRHDAIYEAKKRSKDPDPGKYIPDLATSSKKNWKSIGALFEKGKRETHIDQAIKLSKKTPGPGAYLEQGKRDLEKIPMGKFDKSEKLNFLATIEAIGQEQPESWKYQPYSIKDRKRSNWCKTAKPRPRKKENLGPGCYKEIEKIIEKHEMLSPPKYSIPRAQSATAISLTARLTKNYPGVGKYPNADKVNTMAETIKKSSRRVIHPYKSPRYMDDVIRNAKSGPGPGSYHIGPKAKKSRNS